MTPPARDVREVIKRQFSKNAVDGRHGQIRHDMDQAIEYFRAEVRVERRKISERLRGQQVCRKFLGLGHRIEPADAAQKAYFKIGRCSLEEQRELPRRHKRQPGRCKPGCERNRLDLDEAAALDNDAALLE